MDRRDETALEQLTDLETQRLAKYVPLAKLAIDAMARRPTDKRGILAWDDLESSARLEFCKFLDRCLGDRRALALMADHHRHPKRVKVALRVAKAIYDEDMDIPF